MVLHEKGLGFETFEVELENKSEGFLRVSPTDKVPVAVVDGDPLYGSNVVEQFLDEIAVEPRLLYEDPNRLRGGWGCLACRVRKTPAKTARPSLSRFRAPYPRSPRAGLSPMPRLRANPPSTAPKLWQHGQCLSG